MTEREILIKALEQCADIHDYEDWFFLRTGWMYCTSCDMLHCFPEGAGEDGGKFSPTVKEMLNDVGFLKAFFGDEYEKHIPLVEKEGLKYIEKNLKS